MWSLTAKMRLAGSEGTESCLFYPLLAACLVLDLQTAINPVLSAFAVGLLFERGCEIIRSR